MSLPKSASIRVHNEVSEWRFDFNGFDGDDSFDSFRLTITDGGVSRQFDFRSSVVWGLRWINRFFADPNQPKVERGHVHVYRSGEDFRMAFDYDKKPQEFYLASPEIHLDCEFLPKYDGYDET